MAHIIDRTVLNAGMAAGYYLFFLNAWGSIPLACAAAFAGCLLTRFAARGLARRRPLTRSQARERLTRLAEMDDAEAQAVLASLLRRRFRGEEYSLAVALKHPEATLSSGDILSLWKANRGVRRLVIAATCPCEPRALAYSRELRQPCVAVADGPRLQRIMRRDAWAQAPSPAPREPFINRLRRAGSRVAAARVSPKNALVAAALLALYLVGGNPLNLAASLALLLHMGIAVINRRLGPRLFDEPA